MDIARPATLAEVLRLIGAERPRIVAGATDLFPATTFPALVGPLIDITGIAELCGIASGPAGLRLGAAVTWTEVARAALPPAVLALQEAAREVGGLQIQNAGTLGGNLCNASPAADGVPPLLALDAEVELASAAGSRRLPLGRFLIGPRRTALDAGEILVAVHLPASALRGRSAFLKLGARRHLVISIAMVAVRIAVRDSHVAAAALAVGACGPVATRLPAIEAALVGRPADAALPLAIREAEVAMRLSPIDDVRADAAYRRRAATVLLRRAVAAAVDGRAREAA